MSDSPDGHVVVSSVSSDVLRSMAAFPYCFNYSVSVAAGGMKIYVPSFASPELLYILREVRIINVLNAKMTLHIVGCGSSMGWYYGSGQIKADFIGPYDYLFVYGDVFQISMENKETAARTVFSTIRFDVVLKPADFVVRPTASFTRSDLPYVHGHAMTCYDTSAHNPTSWLWLFGDGSSSTEQNPSHTYASAGNYTIQLFVFNSGGGSMCEDAITVT